MKRRGFWTYALLAVIFVVFTSLAYVLPTQSIFAAIAGNVGLVALIGALFQLLRDNAAHERSMMLERDKQNFQVGATSHMANVVFDKHVVFCETYMAKVRETVDTLIRNHANIDAVTHANELFSIRREHSTWVTAGMSSKLTKFEDAVRTMGAQAQFVRDVAGDPQSAGQRARAIDSVYREFERILPALFGRTGEDGVSADSIEGRVREMLGVNQLVEMRTALVRQAHAATRSD